MSAAFSKHFLEKSFKGTKLQGYGNKCEPVALRKFEKHVKKCHVNAELREEGLYLYCVGDVGALSDGVLCCIVVEIFL